MQNTRRRENREKKRRMQREEVVVVEVGGAASHKYPVASGVRQLGRVSKSFLGARGKGGEVVNQPLRPTPGSWN